MVEFGEEMIIDSFRIPWLIWIQVIVLLLLILLLYSFSLLGSPSDPSPADGSLCSPSAPSSLHGDHSHQKLQPQVGEITRATSRTLGRSGRLNTAGDYHQQDRSRSRSIDDSAENKEGGSSISTSSMFSNNHHPCNIVRLAKVAFLKCLGLDSNSIANERTRR